MNGSDQFEIVFVCTGNRARSPLAEALLRRRVPPGRATVRSVGTLDLGPVPALPEAVRAAALLGADMSTHRAHTLRAGELAAVDLVLGFEPFHLSAAVVDGGAARARTFSIVELAALLEGMVQEADRNSPEQVVQQAHARRTGSFLATPALADPFGASEAVFRRTADEIAGLVNVIARSLFPAAVEVTPSDGGSGRAGETSTDRSGDE